MELDNDAFFIEPARLVPPYSWVGHIPFVSWLLTLLKPDVFVELGTHTGNSYNAACQAIMENKLPTQAYAVDTWAGDEHAGFYPDSIFQELTEYHQPRYGAFSQLLRMSFDDALGYFANGSVDMLHIDGLHTYEAVKHDFETWLPKLSERAVVLFHDTNVFEKNFGVHRLWFELMQIYPGFDFKHCNGLGVLLVGGQRKPLLETLANSASHNNAEWQYANTLFRLLGQRMELREWEWQVESLNRTVTERDAQIGNLKHVVAVRDGQIENFNHFVESLNHVVTERDRQIGSLNHVVAERDAQIGGINHVVAERDAQIGNLSYAVAERDRQIANLMHLVAECDREIVSLNFSIRKIETPLRLGKRLLMGILHPLRTYRLELDIRIIKNSGLFDVDYYLATYRDIRISALDPVRHYCSQGWRENRNPSQSFSTWYYLEANPDVSAAGLNPLVHYIKHGRREGRATNQKDPGVAPPQQHADTLLAEEVPGAAPPQQHMDALLAEEVPGAAPSQQHMDALLAEFDSVLMQPKVSVIVPSYNHMPYLRKRLESIYQQSYPNFEVILIDDASTDGSIDILKEYSDRYPLITQTHFNAKNSGGVFKQWRRGFEMASGQLVWIAESDDFCTTNFLEELVRQFKNEAVMLAFCRTDFVQGDDEKKIWSIEEYLMDLNDTLWEQHSFTMSAHQIVNKAWSVKNILPNVSSAVFKHPGQLELLENEEWLNMTICGDWIFYLHIIRGGFVSYTQAATNYYRIHTSNTSVNSQITDLYYQEHEKVAEHLLALYRLQDSGLQHLRSQLETQWMLCRPEDSIESLSQIFSVERIQTIAKSRKPNVLMAGYALTAGGGETFPIYLANLLKADGFGVTFLNYGAEPTEAGVRGMLRADIPLLEMKYYDDNLGIFLDNMGIEITHSHHACLDTMFCRLLEETPHIKVIVTMHGMYETMDKDHFEGLRNLLHKRVETFVYVADKNLKSFDLNYFGKDRFVKIGNALAAYAPTPVPKSSLGIQEDAFTLCVVSRAIPEKGWQEGIEAVRLAQTKTSRPIHLLMVGDGPEYGRLKLEYTDKNIHFLGFCKNVRDYFASADIGFLPSRFSGESCPLVLIDCLYGNRPMLASNIGEIHNMLQTSDGSLAGSVFDLDDGQIPVGRVADMIAAYANDTTLYSLHLSHVADAAKKFDPQVLLQSYKIVYQKAMNQHPADSHAQDSLDLSTKTT